MVFIFRMQFRLRSKLPGFHSVVRGVKDERASLGQRKESDGDHFVSTK